MNIKELWDKADQLQQEGEGKLKEADGVRWSIARELHVRNGTGESGHTLSTLTGRDRTTIQCYITAWREYGDTDLVFQEAFDLARVARAKREEVRKEAEETNTTVRSTIDRNQKKTGRRTAAKAEQTEDQKKSTEEAVKKATESVKSLYQQIDGVRLYVIKALGVIEIAIEMSSA